MSYNYWISLLSKSYYKTFIPSFEVNVSGKTDETILFLHTLNWSFEDKKGTLFILLDQQKLNNYLKEISYEQKTNKAFKKLEGLSPNKYRMINQ